MAGRRRTVKQPVVLPLRIPADLKDRLRDEAERRDVSMNWLVARAITRYLDAFGHGTPESIDHDQMERA